jgi:LPXTG-site transpeptidase (sortase) family protein
VVALVSYPIFPVTSINAGACGKVTQIVPRYAACTDFSCRMYRRFTPIVVWYPEIVKRLHPPDVDRRLAFGAALSVLSLAFIAIGLFAVVSALTDNPVQLPSEGSIQDILQEGDPEAAPSDDDSAIVQPGDPPLPTGPAPVRMGIRRISIDAPVARMNFEPGTDIPAVPDRAELVAWYDFSAAPALGHNAVFTGHVDWQTPTGAPIPGVFYRLRELQIGDPISVSLEDGNTVQYRVTGNVATKYDDPNVVGVMRPVSKDVITLITCGGSWVNDPSKDNGGNYSHRIIVRAERVTDSVAQISD